jgi:hypothetical protein
MVAGGVQAAPILFQGNGHYYEVYTPGNNGYTWQEANQIANSLSYSGMQGHLATITSQQEFDWITSNLDYEGKFLGGSDANTEGVWEWVTGEIFYDINSPTNNAFSAWEPGEPNNWNNLNEDYLMFWWEQGGSVAGWNDTVNDPSQWFSLGFIVEYDLLLSPSPLPINEPSSFLLLSVIFYGFLRRNRQHSKLQQQKC